MYEEKKKNTTLHRQQHCNVLCYILHFESNLSNTAEHFCPCCLNIIIDTICDHIQRFVLSECDVMWCDVMWDGSSSPADSVLMGPVMLCTCCSEPCPPVCPHRAAWTEGTAPCRLHLRLSGRRSSDTEHLNTNRHINTAELKLLHNATC